MWPGRAVVTVRSVVETDSDTDMGTGRYHRSANGRLVGILLIGLGVVWFLSEIGGLSGETMRAVVLMLLGAGLIYTARRSRGGGRSLWPIALGVILIFSLLGNARSGGRALGLRVDAAPAIIPQSAGELEDHYPGGVARLTIDLRQLQPTDLNRAITIDDPVSDLRVAVPSGVDVVVDTSAAIGQLVVCGQRVPPGFTFGQTYESGPSTAPQLKLHIDGGAGEVRVTCGSPLPPPEAPIPPSSKP
jgi:hypothetical protein